MQRHKDDYIQGIIFSRSSYMDLRKMTAAERDFYKMMASRNKPHDYSKRIHSVSSGRRMVAEPSFILPTIAGMGL